MNACSGRPRVLVIDDSPVILSLVRACLRDQYPVITAGGGRRGLALAAKGDLDLAIVDIEMPEIGGRDVIPALRRLDPSLPILTLSSEPFLPEIAEDLGVDAWLPKPFDIHELRKAVARTLKTASALGHFRPKSHLVRFHAEGQGASASIAAFMAGALRRSEGLIAVVTSARRSEVDRLLRGRDLRPDEAEARGRLIWVDAEDFAERMNPSGEHRPDLLMEAAGRALRSLRRAHAGPIRVFGEAVDVLARTGRPALAREMERTWNRVISREHLHVYCSYEAASFRGHEGARIRHSLQELHTSSI